MSQMYFDVWASDDMNGTSLGHLSDATEKHIRRAFNQIGNGQFVINRHSSQAAWCATDNLIRVRLEAGGPFAYDDDRYVFAFLIEEGAETLLSTDEDGGEDATLGGRDATVILDRAIIWPSANYLPGDPNGNDIYWTRALKDGVVRITTALNGGERNAGTVLRIFIRDAEARSPNPLAPLNDDFNFQLDSNGDNWTENGSEWEFPVGTSLLDLLATLVGSGLYYSVTPDLILHAYNSDPSNDLSATIDFTEGDNIREIADRQVHAPPAKSRVIVKGTSTTDELKYREVVDASVETDLGRREGFIEYEATPTNERLDLAGEKYIAAQLLKHDGPTSLGALDTPGREALIDYFPGDTVTVNITGVYTALELAISAIALNDTESGEYDPVIEFRDAPWDGQNFDPIGRPTSDAPSGGGCRDCPPLEPYVPGDQEPVITPVRCDDGTPGWASQTFPPLGAGSGGNAASTPAPGAIQYHRAGITEIKEPSTTHTNAWHFPTYTGPGGPDTAGRNTSNALRIVVPSTGVLTVDASFTGDVTGSWKLVHYNAGVEASPDQSGSGIPGPITVPDDGHCYHVLVLHGWTGTTGGFVYGTGTTWVPDTTSTTPPYTPPVPGQQGNEQTPGTTGSTTYTTNYPYVPGSLVVTVNGVVVQADETDPAAGEFTLLGNYTGQDVVIRYVIASSTGTGATNPPPDPDEPTSGGSAAHEADATDAHDASAISFVATGLTNTDADDVQEAIADIDDAIDALVAGSVFETVNDGGNPLSQDHHSMGASVTIDAANGNHHRGTLDANCTITVAPFADGAIEVVLYQNGTGGWDVTWSGADFGGADDQPDQTASAPTVYTFLSDDGNVYGFKAGGSGGVASLDDVGDVNAPTPADGDVLAWDATPGEWVAVAPGTPSIDWGETADITTQDYDDVADAGVLNEVARADHLHGMPSAGGGALNNYAATAAPTVTDDDGDGYSVGSVWIDVTNDVPWVCLDATTGAAKWITTLNPIPRVTNSAINFTSGSTSCAVTTAAFPSGSVIWAVVTGTGRGANSITQTNVTWTLENSSSSGTAFVEVWRGVVSGGASGTTATAAFTGSNSQTVLIFELPDLPSTIVNSANNSTNNATAALVQHSATLVIGGWYLWIVNGAGAASSYGSASQPYWPHSGGAGGHGRVYIFRPIAAGWHGFQVSASSTAWYSVMARLTT